MNADAVLGARLFTGFLKGTSLPRGWGRARARETQRGRRRADRGSRSVIVIVIRVVSVVASRRGRATCPPVRQCDSDHPLGWRCGCVVP